MDEPKRTHPKVNERLWQISKDKLQFVASQEASCKDDSTTDAV